MSESFFGLRKRPFAALPDVDCFVPLNGICQAFDNLIQVADGGRGIGVLTAPAGLGKSLVCQRLARELSGKFRVAALPSGNFLTRRSLLQAVLFELGHSFVRMGDQELRLALSATLRAIRPTSRGLVLIVDEAHLLAVRMLEELRALLSLGDGGEPLVRLIVSGQLSLEETLSRPQCDAFNQRIACHVMLPTLSREESSSYLTRRLAWAGANVSDIFAREALIAICEAADGVPRCLHQLADHSLSLGAKRSEKPVSLRTVREALEELKQLPLTWAEPTVGRAASNALETARAQAAAPSHASIEMDGPMAGSANISKGQNRDLQAEAAFDTYPLQTEDLEAEDNRELPAFKNRWELDEQAELISPWADVSTVPAFDETAEEGPCERSNNATTIEALDAAVPANVIGNSAVEFGDAFESEDSIELELNHEVDETEEAAQLETISSDLRQNDHAQQDPQVAEIGQMADAMVLPEIASQTATGVIDEEVVIDRYAALDSALSRLTRTMLNVRANARRKVAESASPPSMLPIPVEALDAVHQRFDVVMPEDDGVEHAAGPKSVSENAAFALAARSATSVVATPASTSSSVREVTPRTTTDERRPYQLLFSELRRRRRRV
jgi:type II secretory pathway predicted ATPase ExeA